jgi:sedoheptulokinase
VGDNQASVVGTVGFALDAAVLNLGTGGQISLPTAGFVRPPGLETRPMPGGGFLLVGASLCGGRSYAYLCQFFRQVAEAVGGAPVDEAAAYERLNALAAAAPDGADGLRADTRFRGTRADASLRGALTGIGAANLTPGGVARAFLEGMVRELAGMIRQPGIPPPREVYASGNAVRRNPLVAALIEREFGAPCRLAPAREEAAVGAARCAARTLGF